MGETLRARTAYLFLAIQFFGCIILPVVTSQPAMGKDRLVEGEPVDLSEAADKTIEQKLSAIYRTIDEFENIRADVVNNVVKLRGQAASFTAAESAVDLAARIEGVIYVVDEIEILAKVDTRVAPAWRKVLTVIDQSLEYIPLIAIAVAVFFLLYLTGRFVAAWQWPFQHFKGKHLLQSLIRQLIRYSFAFVGFLIGLELLDLASVMGAFLGAAGLFGLAIGFALKDIMENYVSGFLLSISSPFNFKDYIAVGAHEGSVVRVTSRDLVLMNLEGNHVRIPNAQVFHSAIYNYTRNPLRRFTINIGVGTNEDLAEVQQIGCAVLNAMRGVVDDPAPNMRTLEFGESTMNVAFLGWVDQKQADFLKVRSEAVRILKEALERAGVEVPVPIHRVIHADAGRQMSEPAAERDDRIDILEDAGRADVNRDTHLNALIERDRQSSDEVDLLPDSG